MKKVFILLCMAVLMSCQAPHEGTSSKIIFLHHSTGHAIWRGNTNYYLYRLIKKGDVQKYFAKYNKENGTNYEISNQVFPKEQPYGWNNFPYDYYNIWVKHAGNDPYLEEPTLEILTESHDVIILKHCYPVNDILEDTGSPDVDSEEKRLENYMLQYDALKEKMHEFPNNKFIIWTPAARVKNSTTEEKAHRTRNFYEWIVNDWDESGDNIYLWDFYDYETEGGLYLKDEYASGPKDSHPNQEFAGRMAPLFGQFVIDCLEGKLDP
jgi:hypothetical protein